MGKTLVIYKITVSDMEKLDSVLQAVKEIKSGEVRDTKKEPIGFGIEIIKTAILIPEKQDEVLDSVTNEIRQIPNVENTEIESMTLL